MFPSRSKKAFAEQDAWQGLLAGRFCAVRIGVIAGQIEQDNFQPDPSWIYQFLSVSLVDLDLMNDFSGLNGLVTLTFTLKSNVIADCALTMLAGQFRCCIVDGQVYRKNHHILLQPENAEFGPAGIL